MKVWLVVAFGLWVAASLAHGAALEEIHLLASSPSGLKAEVVLPAPIVLPAAGRPGYHAIRLGSLPAGGDPGEPALPRVSFWVALPPGATASVTATASDELTWEGIRPLPVARPEWAAKGKDELPIYREAILENPAVYGGGLFPAQLAAVGSERGLRYLRVVPVVVSPARWDASTGTLTIAGRVEIQVTFIPGEARAWGRPVPHEDPSWERTYAATVLNAEQAAGWARAPLPRPVRRRARPTDDLVKLEVRSTGLRRVEFGDLNAIGWPGADRPIQDLRLFESFYDWSDEADTLESEVEVPIFVYDADESGTWTDGDAFFFYAQMLFDRLPEAPWYIKRYGRLHVYWLGLRTGAGNIRMQSVPSWLEGQGFAAVPSYPWAVHLEKEAEMYMRDGAGGANNRPPIDDETDIINGVASVKTKHVYWQGGEPFSLNPDNPAEPYNWYRVAFDLPGFRSPLGLVARFQGYLDNTKSKQHRVHLYLTSGGIQDSVPLPHIPLVLATQDSGRYVATAEELAGMPLQLKEKGNLLIHLEYSDTYGANLHWLEVSYMREPRFVDKQVEIATGSAEGPTEYQVAEAPRTEDLIGVEFTDPRLPKVLAINRDTQVVNRQLGLRWELDGRNRQFWVSAVGSVAKPEGIILDTPSDLLAPGNEDYVIIIPRVWIPEIRSLVGHRTEQGHSVLVAAIEDVYDEFSGGRHWPHAIRSFLRALFRARPKAGPSFLLLVGDASDTFDSELRFQGDGYQISGTNWVPTQTMFSRSYLTEQGPELVSSDQWFVDDLAPEDNGDYREPAGEGLDFLPDMHAGRLPVVDVGELRNIVAKIIAYESFSPDDEWRNRALFFSDDIWSSRITFGATYQPHYGATDEPIFRSAAIASMDVIHNEGPQCGFRTDSFFVASYMDTVRSLGRCKRFDLDTGKCLEFEASASESLNQVYGEKVVGPRLRAAIRPGNLFVSYVGHANGRLMTHEHLFQNYVYGEKDVEKLDNLDKPFVFMGYGCHLAEFSEASQNLPAKKEIIAEQMLHRFPDRGAIAVIASTGYEWINTSDKYNLAVVRSFFKNPPKPRQNEGHTRWILGEVVSASKADVVAQGPTSDLYQSMSLTYTLLGDPGLVMDAAPPRFSMRVDDSPIESGEPLILPADRDSIVISGRVCDEIWTRSLTIQDAGGVVQPDTILADSIGDDRSFRFVYKTTVCPRNYDFTVTADDGNGRVSTVSFPVRLDAEFSIRKPGQEWLRLEGGERVLEGDSVRVKVTAPRYLSSSDLELRVNGIQALSRARPLDPLDARAREWMVELLEPIHSEKEATLSLWVRQPDGADFQVPIRILTEAVFEILELYNVPNPFRSDTWIFYLLGAPAEEVTIRIYTSSGKLIQTIAGPSRLLQNEAPLYWDGRDKDGDPIGNGLYFYKLIVKGSQGTLTKIGKMARVR